MTSYVALGDSFVAGPGVKPVDPQSRECHRSINNWPTLLAKQLHITTFQDVSCSGATSEDILTVRDGATAQQSIAQIDAVPATADLVTLGIGGNDEGVFGRTIVSCAAGGEFRRAPCSPLPEALLQTTLERTTSRIAVALERIRAKAPDARIILVGYLRTLPEPGGCLVPGLASDHVAPAVAGQHAIDDALDAAAKRADVDYISLSAASLGHEACSGDQAWVNGMRPAPGDGAYLHPTSAGMRAVADIVAKHLASLRS